MIILIYLHFNYLLVLFFAPVNVIARRKSLTGLNPSLIFKHKRRKQTLPTSLHIPRRHSKSWNKSKNVKLTIQKRTMIDQCNLLVSGSSLRNFDNSCASSSGLQSLDSTGAFVCSRSFLFTPQHINRYFLNPVKLPEITKKHSRKKFFHP